MAAENRIYYLTEKSYAALIGMSQKCGYVKFGAQRAKGLSPFLIDLAQMPMDDTRPPLVKQRHDEEIKYNRAPTWMNSRLRRARMLSLNNDAIARYLLIAHKMGIIRTEPWIIGGPDRKTPYPTIAIVLEAIGLGWITPREFPENATQPFS